MAARYQRAVSDYFYARGEMPFDYQDLNLADYAPYRDDALRAVVIEPEGVLRLSLRLGNGARGEFRLVPVYQTPAAGLRWRCRAQGVPLIRTVLPECKILDR